MPLTINSNIGASIGNRAVSETTRLMDRSLAKLASGQRVESARDDAASMAVGLRMRAELASLRTATTNAAQATAMLQVADGAYARGQDTLIRMRALATQSQSANLSNVERGMLDAEYRQLVAELDRLGKSTTFGGQQILSGSVDYQYSNYRYISASSDGAIGNATSGTFAGTATTRDGKWVLFSSTASNLVSGDTNGVRDVFLQNTESGEIRRISVSASGAEANGSSNSVAISNNGRFVAFNSAATNLTGTDTNGFTDVFLLDLQTNQLSMITRSSSGGQTNGNSIVNSISDDGRYVVYSSTATNIAAGDTNGESDVFIFDQQNNTTTKISGGFDGGASARISGDGKFVVYASSANLSYSLLYNMSTGETTDLSSIVGTQTAGALISADGRYVTYWASDDNPNTIDTNGIADTYLYDRLTGTVELISMDYSGNNIADGTGAYIQGISEDGRYVYYGSDATIDPNDTNGTTDIFVFDRETRTTRRILGADGQEFNATVNNAFVLNGGRVMLSTSASNAVNGVTANAFSQLVMMDLNTAFSSYNSSTRMGSQVGNQIGLNLGGMGLDQLFWSLKTSSIASIEAAGMSMFAIDNAFNRLTLYRTQVGATVNRLEKASDNIAVALENYDNAIGSLMNVDVASEMARYTSLQIVQQAGISMLTQANQTQKNLIKLLQG